MQLSEDAACFRIFAARAARRFPVIFQMLSDGRLHLTGVARLWKHLRDLTLDEGNELLGASAGKTKREIEKLLAHRFPQPDVPTLIRAIVGSPPPLTDPGELAVSALSVPVRVVPSEIGKVAPTVSQTMQPPPSPPRVQPIAPERYSLQLTMPTAMHDLLREARELLGHEFPAPDVVEVLHRSLRAYVQELRKRKFAATTRPRPCNPSQDPRHVPSEVKRAVWQRDGGQCTFKSDTGQRCEARTGLEYDHILEVARGGKSTIGNVRLRCRAHNQYTAEQAYGEEFMRRRRLRNA